ncbi:MAG: hypothetical protein R2741_11615 [Methanolobus sp.]
MRSKEWQHPKGGTQLSVGLEDQELSGEFQRIGLSATAGNPEEVAKFLAGSEREVSIISVTLLKLLDFRVVNPQVTDEDVEISKKLACDVNFAAHVRCVRDIVMDNVSTLSLSIQDRVLKHLQLI